MMVGQHRWFLGNGVVFRPWLSVSVENSSVDVRHSSYSFLLKSLQGLLKAHSHWEILWVVSVESAYSSQWFVKIKVRRGIFAMIVLREWNLLVSKSVPLVPMQSKRIFIKPQSILNVDGVLKNIVWVNWVLAVYPCCDVVRPLRNIFPVNHGPLLSPLSIWKDPVSINACGIVPVSLKWNDSQREI